MSNPPIHSLDLNPLYINVHLTGFGPQGIQGPQGEEGPPGVSDDINVEVLTDDKLLSRDDLKYQYLDPGEDNRTVTLPSDADKGKVFIVRHIGDEGYAIDIMFPGAEYAADTLYQGSLKSFIYDGTAWRSAIIGTNDGTSTSHGLSLGGNAKGYSGGVAVGRNVSGTENATAIGIDTVSEGNSLAVGNYANAEGQAIAVGNNAVAEGNSISIGRNTDTDNNSLALGRNAAASATGIAIGNYSEGEQNGIAIGQYSAAYENGIAIGQDSESVENGISLGQYAQSYWNGVAIGNDSEGNEFGTAVGYSARCDDRGNGFAKGAYALVTRLGEETKTAVTLEDNWDMVIKGAYSTLAWGGFIENDNPAQWTELFLGGEEDERATVIDQSAFGFSLYCTALTFTNYDDRAKRWKLEGLIMSDSIFDVTLVGSVTKTVIAQSDSSGGTDNWDIRVTADNVNKALKIEVLGEAGVDIRYIVRGEIEEVRDVISV